MNVDNWDIVFNAFREEQRELLWQLIGAHKELTLSVQCAQPTQRAAVAATGLAFFCTETCPFSGESNATFAILV